MDKTPLHSKWSQTFMKIHEGILVRRHITKQLSSENLHQVVQKPMLKYYFSTFLSTLAIYYLLKKSPFSIRFAASSGFLSLTFIYLQMCHEEKVFLSKGLEDSKAGDVIRKNYISLLPNDWITEKFKKKQESIENFHKKYHYREDPLAKFESYASSRNFSLSDFTK